MTHYSAKTDKNQSEIVEALRAAGYSVALTHRIGSGYPDLCVGLESERGHRLNILIEVKRPGEKLNQRETEWHAAWRGQVAVVRNAEEALAVCDVARENL